MDFFKIKEREAGTQKKPVLEVYPDFTVMRSKDLMVRAKEFYAIWDPQKGLWSTDEFDVQRLIDAEILGYETTTTGFMERHNKLLGNFSSNTWLQYRNYVSHLKDNYTQLDEKIVFRNTPVEKEDYVSRRLPYDLVQGDISAWNEIVSTLYSPSERAKIEWAIGAIVSGDSKAIHKFLVFYGAPGTGKSTIMNIIQMLFEGYVETFVAKDLTGPNSNFALASFKSNPLVAIEHDGDLSKITDTSKLNSIVAHEPMQFNEKNKPQYTARVLAMLMIGSNSPVKITDAKSGLIRRLIDVQPTGNLISPKKYQALMNQIPFELGAIAQHSLDVYRSMGRDYYSGYRPVEMMLQTDVFFNFIESNYEIFEKQGGVTLNQAFEMYKHFIKESEIEYSLPRYKMREELKNYFDNFEERGVDANGERVRSWYSGFKADRFKSPVGKKEEHMFSLVMDETESLLDRELAEYPAQYSNADGNPILFWDNSERINKEGEKFTPKPNQVVSTRLKDLDTTKEHYVKVPENHIVIDFDLKDKDGKKSAERNLEAASVWPPTYAEFSKSGDGIHLHYTYVGAVEELSNHYDDGIEVKVYSGNSALRRRLTRCNNVPVAEISSGLPIKEKKVLTEKEIADEKHLRALIAKALRKEVHPGTKSNVDYIHHVLEEAYAQGMSYNVTDLKGKIIHFAASSTNQAAVSIKLVQSMKFASEDTLDKIETGEVPDTFKSRKTLDSEKEVIFDVEVFPNLFVVCWKYKGAPKESIVRMINPTARDIEQMLPMKLVGFNNRQYDNHIMYAAYMGEDNHQLFKRSVKIIEGAPNAKIGKAYDLSYTDIYDFSSVKQGLKKWEIELGIHHMELGLPWDQPVPPELWDKVAEYCANDVEATDVVRQHLEPDFIARQILSDLSGLSVNSTTQQHAARILFGENRRPQEHFVYTDLSEMFPGYKHGFKTKEIKSTSGTRTVTTYESEYRGEITGEGGYVYAEPGMYENVAVLDVASMHPTSIEVLNLFGETFTKTFSEIKALRIAIKRGNYDEARKMLGGKLAKYLENEEQAEALSYALKIVINIVYGLTSAKFDNAFRDPRNIDNIVAKRGALFMIELKHAVQEKGFQVVHIKTDSIKIPGATPEIIQFVNEFGASYGYEFEHEATYEKFCLVNEAVYIAKVGWAAKAKKIGTWEAVGKQFQQPYVYKTLFSKEPIEHKDLAESREVKAGAMHLDYTGLDDTPMAFTKDLDETKRRYIGKTGLFSPMLPGTGGGVLLRVQDDKHFAVAGTKGFQWLEKEVVDTLGLHDSIDKRYFRNLVDGAIEQIKKFGDYEWFVS